jgi:hypothetical protein
MTTLLALLLVLPALAAAPREDFKTLTAALQADANDEASREKLLKLVPKLKPAPATPVEARRHFIKGVTLQKEAKNPAELAGAVAEYRLAVAAAPWWADAYYNMSVAQEGAGDFAGARKSLNHYLLTSPKDAEAAQDRLFALEAKEEKAAKEKAKASWLSGTWSAQMYSGRTPLGAWDVEAKRDGDAVILRPAQGIPVLRLTEKDGGDYWEFWVQEFPDRPGSCPVTSGWSPKTVNVSADRRSISFRTTSYGTHDCATYGTKEYVITRK